MRLRFRSGIREALARVGVRGIWRRALGRPRLGRADLRAEARHVRCNVGSAFISTNRVRRTVRAHLGVSQRDEQLRIAGLPAKRVVARVYIRVRTTGVEITLYRRCRAFCRGRCRGGPRPSRHG
jgi:hypothetical protein